MGIKNDYSKHVFELLNKTSNYLIEVNQNIWYSFLPRNIGEISNQGWKIHVSISAKDCLKILKDVVPFLILNNIFFKIPIDANTIISINSGEYGQSQIGKTITIYPKNEMELKFIVESLSKIIDFESGPCVPSDIRLSENSPIFLRYGTFTGNQIIINENGLVDYYLIDESNKRVKEVRSLDGTQPVFAPKLPFNTLKAQDHYYQEVDKFEKEFIPISLLYKSFKSDITIGLHKDTGKILIQKRAYAKICGNFEGKDNTDFLKNEFNILKELGGKLNCPIVYSFEKLDNYSVIYEDFIEGKSLMGADISETNNISLLLFEELYKLHNLGISHNDIKPTNIIYSNGKIYLTDFELAERLGTLKKNIGGTKGYTDKNETKEASIRNDYFAFSVCIANLLLSVENSILLLSNKQIIKMLNIYGFQNAVKLINELEKFDFSPRKYDKICFLLADINAVTSKEKISKIMINKWFENAIDQQLVLIKRKFKKINKDAGYWTSNHSTSYNQFDYGINTGNSGMILGLLTVTNHLKTTILDKEIKNCLNFLYNYDENIPFGFFNGQSGVALALIKGGIKFENHKYVSRGQSILINIPELEISWDFFNGYASILFSIIQAYYLTRDDRLLAKAKNIYSKIILRKQEINDIIIWPTGEDAFTGAAHGTSGIALVILLYSKIAKDLNARNLAIKCLRSIYYKSREMNLNTILHNMKSEDNKAPIFSWCHGVEGYLWCLIFDKDSVSEFEEEIDWCVNILKVNKSITNPCMCHGLAGQLELWNMLRVISKHNQIAKEKIGEIITLLKISSIKNEKQTTWYSDEVGKLNFDLWVGSLAVTTVFMNYKTNNFKSIINFI